MENFKKGSKNLVGHIFRANHQWKALQHYKQTLNEGDILLVSDYQQNLEEIHSEMPTSMAYSGNRQSNEGKNVSDVIGAMGNNSFRRGIHKNRSGITGVEDAISRIKANLQGETKEFKHIIYEIFPTIKRLSKEEQRKKEEPLKGIMKFHQIYVDSRGKLQGRELSCLTCTVRYRCTKCK